jgi:hypothetical protein
MAASGPSREYSTKLRVLDPAKPFSLILLRESAITLLRECMDVRHLHMITSSHDVLGIIRPTLIYHINSLANTRIHLLRSLTGKQLYLTRAQILNRQVQTKPE